MYARVEGEARVEPRVALSRLSLSLSPLSLPRTQPPTPQTPGSPIRRAPWGFTVSGNSDLANRGPAPPPSFLYQRTPEGRPRSKDTALCASAGGRRQGADSGRHGRCGPGGVSAYSGRYGCIFTRDCGRYGRIFTRDCGRYGRILTRDCGRYGRCGPGNVSAPSPPPAEKMHRALSRS